MLKHVANEVMANGRSLFNAIELLQNDLDKMMQALAASEDKRRKLEAAQVALESELHESRAAHAAQVPCLILPPITAEYTRSCSCCAIARHSTG